MPDSYRAGLLLVSMGGGVAATAAYRRVAAAGAPLSTTFVVGAFADAVLGLSRLIVVQADRRRDGGDDGGARAPMGALVASDALTSFGQMMGYMPVLALAARCAPRGLEATGYSALLFVADLATGVGSLLAAELTRSMGLGAGHDIGVHERFNCLNAVGGKSKCAHIFSASAHLHAEVFGKCLHRRGRAVDAGQR